MKREFTVDSADELCDLMCGGPEEDEEEPQWWYFTYGVDHEYSNYYTKIKGTYHDARAKMFELHGDKWCWQYSEDEWDEIKNDPKRFWDMGKLLEEIEL